VDRRFITVLGASLLLALVISAIFYQMVVGGRRGGRPAKVATRDIVVAARALPPGATLTAADLKLAKIPVDQFPAGCFSRIEEVAERPVASSILADEPVREGRLALKGSGVGLAPVIPPGMRAVAVRVNDVVSVAGFALPGMRVDVLATGRAQGEEGLRTKTVLQDIPVLSVGKAMQAEASGQAINAPVVTLLVTPSQAEVLTLAGESRIQLVLRNANDHGGEATPGRQTSDLFGQAAPPPKPVETHVAPRPPKEKVVVAVAPPTTDDVVVFRGNVRTVEQVVIRR
jgi:pilus assembly protein CpaB